MCYVWFSDQLLKQSTRGERSNFILNTKKYTDFINSSSGQQTCNNIESTNGASKPLQDNAFDRFSCGLNQNNIRQPMNFTEHQYQHVEEMTGPNLVTSTTPKPTTTIANSLSVTKPDDWESLGNYQKREFLNLYAVEYGFDKLSYADWKIMSKDERLDWIDEKSDIVFNSNTDKVPANFGRVRPCRAFF